MPISLALFTPTNVLKGTFLRPTSVNFGLSSSLLNLAPSTASASTSGSSGASSYLSPTTGNDYQYLTRTTVSAPISVIRTGERYWTEPERLAKTKMLLFTLGLDTLPLRRVCVIANEAAMQRFSNGNGKNKCPSQGASGKAGGIRNKNFNTFFNRRNDVTGFRRSRYQQMVTWYRRIQYQEMFLEHLFIRHSWSLVRKYPPMGVKMPFIVGNIDSAASGSASSSGSNINLKDLSSRSGSSSSSSSSSSNYGYYGETSRGIHHHTRLPLPYPCRHLYEPRT